MNDSKVKQFSLFTDYDITRFKQGLHYRIYKFLGSHLTTYENEQGCYFAVWAPNAITVHVIGTFNGWNFYQHPLNLRFDGSGIWEGFIAGVKAGDIYKYLIGSPNGVFEKCDPYCYFWEVPPRTGSIVWDIDEYKWGDEKWLTNRKNFKHEQQPISIYEVHLGSWMKPNRTEESFLTYDQLKEKLIPYVKEMGFTHVELMPVMEHPYYPSWGYQVLGYYAPTSRFGTPQEFMGLVDAFHDAGIGVILDWVPSHFPSDGHALAYFDGTHLYEHPNPQKGYHPDWNSLIFNYERFEVVSFLISNAMFWCDYYHADGLRVDAVASMIYLDFSRNEGEWMPNKYGGRENIDAISFIHNLNNAVHTSYPVVLTIAEESTAFPLVTQKTYEGGLGFDQKWMMGWMHDTLKYFSMDPIGRQYNHQQITFSMVYAYSEKFCLALSHDEVVHGKASLIYKMFGDTDQKFAQLRLLYTYMYTHPGSKLLFMGCEFAQTNEWSHITGLDWQLLKFKPHLEVQQLVKKLNQLLYDFPALYYYNFDPSGFEWLVIDDYNQSILVYLRKSDLAEQTLLVVLNFTPVVRENYEFGIDSLNKWRLVFNSDDPEFGGSGIVLKTPIKVVKSNKYGKKGYISLTIPAFGACIFSH